MFLPSATVDIDMISARNIKQQKGFTLIELLVVIGILAVLLAITLIAINPARQFAQANDTKRRSDVNAILNAIDQYAADNHGSLPGTFGTCTSAAPCTLQSGGAAGTVDICAPLVTKYLAALPVDPKTGTDTTAGTTGQAVSNCTDTYNTDYKLSQASGGDNRITISATGEIDTNISVTR